MRYVVLVAGPPCAGKTYFIQRNAAAADTVLDRDVIPGPHPERAARHHLARIAAMTNGTAWVIRSVPDAAAREELARYIKADTVMVLLPPPDVLTARAQLRPDPVATHAAIAAWKRSWSPSHNDTVITGTEIYQAPETFHARMDW